jgi:sugar phosphate isomerase/epimerase
VSIPIALQLYSVRDQMPQGYEKIIRQVAAMGYVGVETAGFPGTTSQAAGRLFRELGLAVPAGHIFPPPVGDKLKEALDILAAIGCRRIVSGLGPDDFKTPDAIKRSCDRFNQAGREAAAHGISLCIHNHWWEYQPVEGRYPYQVMLESLDPAIGFELDTYWIKTGGCDPVAVVKEHGRRAPLLHIKDGPAIKEAPMVAVGAGVMDFPAILKAAAGPVEWLIVELDRCATDMMEAVAQSYRYLAQLH